MSQNVLPHKLAFVLLLLSVAATASPPATTSAAEDEIRAVLNAQVTAWNRGNVKGYMQGYWNSPDLTLFSNGTTIRGWQEALDGYRKRYQAKGEEMGKLEFSNVGILVLAPDAALARGRWRLSVSGGRQMQGLFTLILRKFPEGWRIVHDHSSAQ